MKRNAKNRQNCAGNALFLILVAIALIAALTIAVTRSDVTDSESVEPEQARIMASNILSQARMVEDAVNSLLSRGCSEQTISFQNPVVGVYTNPDAPSDGSCHIFRTEGAGLSWLVPMANANDGTNWRYVSGNAVGGVTTTDDGSCASGCIDPMMVLPYVTREVCRQINVLSGVSDSALDYPPVDAGNFLTNVPIAGIDATGTGEPLLDAGNVLYGHRTGCFMPTNINGAGASGSYWFYHVLIVR